MGGIGKKTIGEGQESINESTTSELNNRKFCLKSRITFGLASQSRDPDL
jgi:hypothetical protein